MASIGPFIREKIIPAGVSVSEAARRLGVGRPALSNLLNGNATLSRDMALKLERVFGADANMLIRRQAELEAQAWEVGGEARATSPATGFLKITSTDIEHWAETIPSRTVLPVLLRRLVHTDVDRSAKVDFPGHDAGERHGWDGLTETRIEGRWVPAGRTGWELSTSADFPGKPNRDFQSRAKLPQAERAEMTFAFVTARNWPGKDAWVTKQKALGAWRDIRVLDAGKLEQWLECSPITQIWFMGELGRSVEGIRSISDSWRDWSQSTSPPLSPLLFEEALKANRQTLVDWIGSESEHPFVVVADSAAEALAFLALALREDDGTEGMLHDRAAVATSPDALRRLSAASRDAILVVANRETELAASGITRRNRIIVVRPRTSVESDPNIALENPSSEAFAKALADMGVSEGLREQLKDESGLSPTILRRRLALIPELRLPEWAHDKTLLWKLLPMLLAGAWNCAVEADRILVAELAGRNFEEVEVDLADLLAVPDTPVWAIGNHRGMISRKDALFAAGVALSQEAVDRFFVIAELILSEDDPSLDLPPEERWKANIYGKKREISGAMRSAVSELLVLLAVYGGRVLGPNVGPVDIRVDALVSKLLRDVESRRWLSQQYDLPLLAEAAPRAFLEAAEADLRSNDPQLLAMLRPAGSGPFDSPDRSGLLWALETIAWNETHLFRVARILGRLSEVPINDNWVNKPENSLESLIRSWLPQTAANIEQRVKLLDILVREYPAVAWRLCKAQIDTARSFATPNSRPRWRTDAAGAGTATYEDDYRMRRHALECMLAWPWLDMSQLGDLIELSADLENQDQTRIWARVRKWIDAGPSEEERAALRERMRRSILSRRARKKARPNKIDKLRQTIFESLAPTDLIQRHRWLFAEHWVSESGDEIGDGDFDYKRHEEHIDTLRRGAMTEIVGTHGLDGIGRLLPSVNAWGIVGRYLCQATPLFDRQGLVATLVEHVQRAQDRNWFGCLQGVLQMLSEDERDAVLRSLLPTLTDEAAISLLKCAPFEGQTWNVLTELRADLEVSYWREVAPYSWRQNESELNLSVERLLDVDRPISAFNSISYNFKALDGAVLGRLMKALIQPTAETDFNLQIDATRISDALDALQASSAATLPELAQLEYFFVNALAHSSHGIPNLERQIEVSPADFVHLVSLLYRREDGNEDPPELRIQDDRNSKTIVANVFRTLGMLKRTPGTQRDGSVDSSILLAWLSNVRERFSLIGRAETGDGQIGQLLGRAAQGTDGIWPNEAVRDALETYGNDRMLNGVRIGLFNNRGATWRGPGGEQERDLASKYRAFGHQLRADYPVTARMLEDVARMYDSQAEWHDNDEAVRNRLHRR